LECSTSSIFDDVVAAGFETGLFSTVSWKIALLRSPTEPLKDEESGRRTDLVDAELIQHIAYSGKRRLHVLLIEASDATHAKTVGHG